MQASTENFFQELEISINAKSEDNQSYTTVVQCFMPVCIDINDFLQRLPMNIKGLTRTLSIKEYKPNCKVIINEEGDVAAIIGFEEELEQEVMH